LLARLSHSIGVRAPSSPDVKAGGRPSTRAAPRKAASAAASHRTSMDGAPVCFDSFWPSGANTSGACR
jgi:hypothetical protein